MLGLEIPKQNTKINKLKKFWYRVLAIRNLLPLQTIKFLLSPNNSNIFVAWGTLYQKKPAIIFLQAPIVSYRPVESKQTRNCHYLFKKLTLILQVLSKNFDRTEFHYRTRILFGVLGTVFLLLPQMGMTAELSEAEIISQVREKNLRLLAEKLNIDIARAEKIQAALWTNPAIGLTSSLNPFRREYDQTTSAGPRQIDLELVLPVDLSGKRASRTKSAQLALEIAIAVYTDKIRTTIRDARIAFINCLQLKNKLNLIREKKNAMQNLVRILENRIGTTARGIQPLLLDRTRLAVENAAYEERVAESEYLTSLAELRVLIGYSGTDEIFPIGNLRTEFPVFSEGLTDLLLSAREKRPDIKAAQLAIALAQEQKKLATAERWEDIEFSVILTRQLGVNAPPATIDEAGNVIHGNSIPGENSFGFGVRIPLPTLDRKQGSILKAEQEIRQSELNFKALERETENEVIRAWNRMKAMRNNLNEYEWISLRRAQRVKDAQQRLFGTGGVNLLEYFDAYEAYFATITGYYDAAAELRKASIELEAAAGLGIEHKEGKDNEKRKD
ncbi:MAG: TolC family protein [Fischerella sp.]|nr:TolC family protein [Fischerella sp.]